MCRYRWLQRDVKPYQCLQPLRASRGFALRRGLGRPALVRRTIIGRSKLGQARCTSESEPSGQGRQSTASLQEPGKGRFAQELAWKVN